jgi:hypothetical protein
MVGGAALAQVRCNAVAADRLADLERSQAADHPRPGRQAHQQRGQSGHHGAKGQVLEHPEETELGRERL